MWQNTKSADPALSNRSLGNFQSQRSRIVGRIKKLLFITQQTDIVDKICTWWFMLKILGYIHVIKSSTTLQTKMEIHIFLSWALKLSSSPRKLAPLLSIPVSMEVITYQTRRIWLRHHFPHFCHFDVVFSTFARECVKHLLSEMHCIDFHNILEYSECHARENARKRTHTACTHLKIHATSAMNQMWTAIISWTKSFCHERDSLKYFNHRTEEEL